VGEEKVIDLARRLGITTPIPAVPSIHIGAADVVPLEMIASYTAFANNGTRSVPKAILRVEDAKGEILWQPAVEQAEALSPGAAWLVADAMRDVVRRGTAASSVGAQISFPAGGKTGTTNDYRDVWFVGFTPDLVAGVWVGFDKPVKIMNNAQGGRLAAPAWTQMMKEIYDRRGVTGSFARPDSLVVAEIDKTTGERVTPFCPLEVRVIESYLPGTEPQGYCPTHGGSAMPSPLQPTVRLGPSSLEPQTVRPGAPPPTSPPATSAPVRPVPPRTGAMGGAGPDGKKPR
jgi:penicillin-binding protein 1A